MASHYVDISEQIVTSSADWLIKTQNPDGSFPEKGTVNNRGLQVINYEHSEYICKYSSRLS